MYIFEFKKSKKYIIWKICHILFGLFLFYLVLEYELGGRSMVLAPFLALFLFFPLRDIFSKKTVLAATEWALVAKVSPFKIISKSNIIEIPLKIISPLKIVEILWDDIAALRYEEKEIYTNDDSYKARNLIIDLKTEESYVVDILALKESCQDIYKTIHRIRPEIQWYGIPKHIMTFYKYQQKGDEDKIFTE